MKLCIENRRPGVLKAGGGAGATSPDQAFRPANTFSGRAGSLVIRTPQAL